ncbi:MAG: Sir2 family NAD-dependent protein deacetylase, partial [Planctomycetota bacterium]
YNMRRSKILSPEIAPNAAHQALADFEASYAGEFLLVTQNVDDLHQRAGSKKILPMHGELLKVRCLDTGEVYDWREDLNGQTPHPNDASRLGRLRPHIVWFGEMPMGMEMIEHAATSADVFLAIGTSGVVYPAAGIVEWTPPGCRKIEVNLDDTPKSPNFDEALRGKASEVVPNLLKELADAT